MRRALILACLFSMALTVAGENVLAEQASPEGALDIGSRLELFVDDYLIEHLGGRAEQRLHRPARQGVAMVTDRPWEGNASHWRIVFQDGDRYRMYYMGGALRAEGRGDDLLPPRSLPLLCRKRRRHPLEATGSRFGGVPGLRAEQHPSSQGQLPRFGAGSRLDGTLSRSQSHCTGEGPLQGPGLRKGSPWTLRSRIG